MSPSRKRGKTQSPNSRAKKKHKRLDAISDRPLPDPHSFSDDDDDDKDSRHQLRRSSRARRAPQVLDSSPVPSNRRKKKKKANQSTTISSKKKETSVLATSVQEEENEDWRSRLRVRVKSGKAKGKALAGERSARVSRRGKMVRRRLIKADRSQEDASNSKGLVLEKGKTLKRKREIEMPDEVFIKSDQDEEEEEEGEGEEEEEKVESDAKELEDGEREEGDEDEPDGEQKAATFDLNKLEAVEREDADDEDDEGKEKASFEELEAEEREEADDEDDEGNEKASFKELEAEGREGDKNVGKEKSTKEFEGLKTCEQAEEETEAAKEVGGSPGIETEKIADREKMDDAKTDENANNNAVTSEKCIKESDMASPMSDNKLSSTRVKEGRRCGLCGGGTDGKPPKKLVRESVDSDNEAYEGSSASEEPNYDVWDGFGDEPGWLGKLLGPIHDRFGIARVWVHQHCAVWSPEVH